MSDSPITSIPIAIALAEKARQVIDRLTDDKKRMLRAIQRIHALSYEMNNDEYKRFVRSTLEDLIKELEQ